jgi:uncharacterized protein YndB with AHSA1/START domain
MAPNSTPETMSADGTAEEVGGRYVLRFERRFRHPIEKVWDALTQPERLKEWMGEVEVELDLVEGGRRDTRTIGPPELVDAIVAEAGEEQLVSHDTVLRVEPPTLFEHTFGGDPGSIARWELRRDGDGTRLTLTHTEPAAFDIANGPRDLAGWHSLLDLLGSALDGKPMPWLKERWEELRGGYAAKPGS